MEVPLYTLQYIPKLQTCCDVQFVYCFYAHQYLSFWWWWVIRILTGEYTDSLLYIRVDHGSLIRDPWPTNVQIILSFKIVHFLNWFDWLYWLKMIDLIELRNVQWFILNSWIISKSNFLLVEIDLISFYLLSQKSPSPKLDSKTTRTQQILPLSISGNLNREFRWQSDTSDVVLAAGLKLIRDKHPWNHFRETWICHQWRTDVQGKIKPTNRWLMKFIIQYNLYKWGARDNENPDKPHSPVIHSSQKAILQNFSLSSRWMLLCLVARKRAKECDWNDDGMMQVYFLQSR